MKPRTRYSPRPRFCFEVKGNSGAVLVIGAASEWWFFHHLRRIGRDGDQLARLEVNGHELTARSLGALNLYLRSGAIRRFKSRRWDAGKELIGWGEWARFCKMLGLAFEGKAARAA